MRSIRKRLTAAGLLTIFTISTLLSLLLSLSRELNETRSGNKPQFRSELREQPSAKQRTCDVFSNHDGIHDIELVVFGDSWVDDKLIAGQEKRGKTWPEVFCQDINCTSRLTFAASQPQSSYPYFEPVGVYTSHRTHDIAHNRTSAHASHMLPDLESQIDSYLSISTSNTASRNTIFLLSLGFWDIHSLAALTLNVSRGIIEQCIYDIFGQLDRLYENFNGAARSLDMNQRTHESREFCVILPKVLDPTLSPGWLKQRNLSQVASSTVEQQKNAIYLTGLWNEHLENKTRAWNLKDRVGPKVHQTKFIQGNRKLISILNIPQILLDIIFNYYTDSSLRHDAVSSSLECLHEPCVKIHQPASFNSMSQSNTSGVQICTRPENFMWWDAWHVGPVGNDIVGKSVRRAILEHA
ncbi:unnamed protein product [Blumeria hordei]|uniref:Uncharacterized protein n=1 Tax=Blumeria hordei TaxID=2867405 RepID=A0A383UTN5_BLUHO|nr:unnamed protein product [Blumeria hordei]